MTYSIVRLLTQATRLFLLLIVLCFYCIRMIDQERFAYFPYFLFSMLANRLVVFLIADINADLSIDVTDSFAFAIA